MRGLTFSRPNGRPRFAWKVCRHGAGATRTPTRHCAPPTFTGADPLGRVAYGTPERRSLLRGRPAGSLIRCVDWWGEWEGTAAHGLATAMAATPVSAYAVARGNGLEIEPYEGSGATLVADRGVIQVNPKVRRVRRHGLIAHEVGHWLLRQEKRDSERGAQYIAGALLVPGRELSPSLKIDWSIRRIQSIHKNASAEVIAHRIVQMRERDAIAAIVDNGRLRKRIASAWLPDPMAKRIAKLTPLERRLVDLATESGEEVRDGLSCAYPILDEPGHTRVVVVAELEQLSLRL